MRAGELYTVQPGKKKAHRIDVEIIRLNERTATIDMMGQKLQCPTVELEKYFAEYGVDMSKPKAKRGHLGRKSRRRGKRKSERRSMSLRTRQKLGLTKKMSRNQMRKMKYKEMAEKAHGH
jgi:hypothetical protein